MPATRFGALLWRRVAARVVAMLPKRDDAKLVLRADTLWTAANAWSAIDRARATLYFAEHALVAARMRDAYRRARALAAEAVRNAGSNRKPARTQALLDRGMMLGGMSGEPEALSIAKGTAGRARLLEGRFRDAARLLHEARQINGERVDGTLGWEQPSLQLAALQASAYLGELTTLQARVPALLRDAMERGDRSTATSCRGGLSVWAWLAQDDAGRASREVLAAESEWSQPGTHLQQWLTTQALAELDLYNAQPQRALERLEAEWKRMGALRDLQYTRIEQHLTRARLSLAQARSEAQHNKRVSSARRDARTMAREGAPWAVAMAQLVEACAASFDDSERALTLLCELDGMLEVLDMRLHQQVARYRLGQLRGGEEGRALVQRAAHELTALGVVRPQAFVSSLAPGFPRVDDDESTEGGPRTQHTLYLPGNER